MTIITTCPHCKTTFNVADAILNKYKGLVRCASCSNVFNAIENEIKKNIQNSPSLDALNNQKVNQENTVPNNLVAEVKTQASNLKPASVSANTESVNIKQQILPQIKSIPSNIEEQKDHKNEKSSSIMQSSMPVSISIFEIIKDKFSFLNFRKNKHEETEDNTPRTLIGNTNLNKRLNSWGYSQKKRPLFIIGNIILAFALFIQLIYWQKDNIANSMPSLSPALKIIAKIFGGQLAPLKLKDNPVVSFSDMQKDLSINANRYILNVGLQNRYAGEAAMPSLEISLFDLNEQIITRRVFHPQVFLKPADWKRLEKYGLRANEELPIKLRFETNQAISSFKVVVFYP